MTSEYRSRKNGGVGPPPTTTERVVAERVLVVAPHYDDEILGCGGLLFELADAAASIHVVFLTDSAASGEVREREGVSRRRRSESERVGELGGWGATHLDLPDGQLVAADLSGPLLELLLDFQPDLILAPSPAEASADHRAAARGVYDLLHVPRDAQELPRELVLLYYEVNQPVLPDLLVDVTRQVRRIETAMELYASQQELHDYRAAALGLRRYRTHALASGVEAAEAYCRFSLAEIRSLGWSAVAERVRGLGLRAQVIGQRPTVSVVVRTKDRPLLLLQALESLAENRLPPTQVIVVNDGGQPVALPKEWPFRLDQVDHVTSRGRAEAANAGIEVARGEAIAFLDDDDTVLSEHFEVLTGALAAPGVDVAYSDAAVVTYELAESGGGWTERERRRPYSRDFDRALLLVDNYIPFNTLLVPRRLYEEVGPLDNELDVFEDWDFLIRLTELVPLRHLPQVTCEYRHFLAAPGHALAGRSAEDRQSSFLRFKAAVLHKHRAALDSAQLATAVVGMRREVVDANERVRSEVERRRADFERFQAEVSGLRREVGDQNDAAQRVLQERAGSLREVELLRARCGEIQEELAEVNRQRELARAELAERDCELRAQYAYGEELREDLRLRQVSLEEERQSVARERSHADQEFSALHAEIGRLTEALEERAAHVAEIKRTKAWRLHERFERLRGRNP